jgi:hypothetical protein
MIATVALLSCAKIRLESLWGLSDFLLLRQAFSWKHDALIPLCLCPDLANEQGTVVGLLGNQTTTKPTSQDSLTHSFWKADI